MSSFMSPLTEESPHQNRIEVESEDLHTGGGIIIGSREIWRIVYQLPVAAAIISCNKTKCVKQNTLSFSFGGKKWKKLICFSELK